MLVEKIKNRESGIILYGITPPKLGTSPEKITEIANRQIHRLESLNIDGLILYDLQDETVFRFPRLFTGLWVNTVRWSCCSFLKTHRLLII